MSIHRSILDVYGFISDLGNHRGVLPSGWTGPTIMTPHTAGLGASCVFEMQVGGQPMQVQVVVIEDEAPRRFVEQCHSTLEHTRTWQFESIVDRTRVRLMLEYVPQPGFWGRLTDRTVVQPSIRKALHQYLDNVKVFLERGRGTAEPGRGMP